MRPALPTLLTLILLLKTATSGCGPGTLACSSSSGSTIPVVCDFHNSFLLDSQNNTCVQQTIPNCQVPALPNKSLSCFQCLPEHVLDAEQAKCVKVQSQYLKSHCLRYATQSFSCLECGPGFFISAGACVALGDNPIEGCAVYDSPSSCAECAPGRFLTEGKCAPFSPLKNCLLHRHLSCDRCQDQYFFNPSANPGFNESSFVFGSFDFDSLVKFDAALAHYVEGFSANECQPGAIKNCRVYESFSVCRECQEGHYLNSVQHCDREQEEPIKHCFEYKSATECSKCEPRFYLNLASNSCEPVTPTEGCAEYALSQNRCAECDSKNYLSPSFSCLNERTFSLNIKNCATRARDKDECAECSEGNSLSSNKRFCFPDIEHCLTQTQSNGTSQFHTCSQCAEGFHASEDRSQCVLTKINQCKQISPNQNVCSECEEGHFFDPQLVACVKQSIPNCAEFSPMSNNCTRCQNLFFLVNNSCQSIQLSQFCFKSDGLNNICSECLPQYLSSNGSCSTGQTRDLSVLDRLCASNQDTVISSNCTNCGDQNFMLQGTQRAQNSTFLESNHCAKVHPDTGACSQCAENSSGEDGRCKAPEVNSTSDCLQLMENSFIPLENSKCAKCRDPRTKYLDTTSNMCRSRANVTSGEACQELPEDDGDCLLCAPEKFPVTSNNLWDKCYLQASIVGYVAIPQCVVYDISTLSCFTCRDDYKLANNNKACVQDTSSVDVFFNNGFNLVAPPADHPQVLNCSAYAQVDLTGVKCTQCNAGHVHILNLKETESFAYYHSLAGKLIGANRAALFVEKCEPYLNSFQLESGGASVSTDTCAVGMQLENASGYLCLRCKDGFVGQVVRVNRDRAGKALEKVLHGVANCAPDTSLKNDFLNLGYQHRFAKKAVPYSTFINVTNCQNASQAVIFNSLVGQDAQLELFPIQSSEGVQNVLYCATLSALASPFSQTVPNCQIFAFRSEPAPTHSPVSPPVDACLACKPGFKAVVDGEGFIVECSEIPNCLNLSLNKYLNGCSLPEMGYFLDSLENNRLIKFDEPMDQNKISSCVLYSSDKEECLSCVKGYSLNGSVCQNVTGGPGSLEFQCSSFGYGFNHLTLASALDPNQRLNNYVFFLQSYNEFFINRKTVCSQCRAGHIVAIESNSTKSTCTAAAGVDQSLLVPNCLNYLAQDPPKCGKCKPGFIPNELNGQCEGSSSYLNCASIWGLGSKKCTSCVEGYSVSLSGTCVQTNCARFLEGECTLCADGHRANGQNSQYCEFNLDSADPCLAYSPTLGTCGKCKNSSILFLFYEKQGDAKTLTGFACETGNLIPDSQPGWRDYHLDEVYVESVLDPVALTVVNSLKFINNDRLSKVLFTNSDPSVNPAAQHCLPKRPVPDCHPEHLLSGTVCTKCTNGFLIDPQTNSCKTGPIPNCNTYGSAAECEQCLDTHYLFNPSFCSPYTQNMNCKESHSSKNECVSCEEGFFMNNLKHCEQRNLGLNCRDFEVSENKCVSCLEGFVMHAPTRTCVKRVAKNCLEVQLQADKCETCKPGHWKDARDGGVCKKSTFVEHCEEFLPEEDGCAKCSSNFYVADEKQKCRHKPDGIISCEAYSDFGVCRQCKPEHYLANNQCIPVTRPVDDCLYYQADGACRECAPSLYLDVPSNSCQRTELSNCLEFRSPTECKKCAPNYVLTWNQQLLECEPSGIDYCLTAIGGARNICLKCEEGKILSSDKSRCEETGLVVPNCSVSTSSAQCKECKPGFVRSGSWRQCEARRQSASTVASRCVSEVQSHSLICDLCKPGFKKGEGGECLKCGGNGCAICGSGLLKCNLCQNGFYMNPQFECVLSSGSVAVDKD